jgi:pyruvate/2-oxoglutarate dehydrogenase complex dihydrolipoamide dehydrogenase (E3) component
MTAAVDADVVVLGMGPGGEDLAGKLAEAGLDVVGVESNLVGGECPYWGCIPSKMMIRAGNLLAEAGRVPGMAGSAHVEPDFDSVAARIREATSNWDDTAAADRFVGKGGRLLRGRGRLAGPGIVMVEPADPDAESVRIAVRRAVVVSTGTQPNTPPIPGLADLPYWTNRDAIAATEVPDSLLVLGGGAIGLELAQLFARFGAAVTIIEGSDRLLAAEEPEASQLLAEVLDREGVTVLTDAKVSAASHNGTGFTLTVDDLALRADRLLVATGRGADLSTLGLESVGLSAQAKWLQVDDHLRAGDGLWAVGDVTGRGAFTHVAMYQSAIAVADILDREHEPARYDALPRVTFTDPEVGAVGLTEHSARAQGMNVRTGVAQVPSTTRGWIHNAGNEGFIKLVEDTDSGVLVGATSTGPTGGEVLGALVVAVHAQVPVSSLRTMMYAYPTFHRGIEDALRALTG